MELVGTLQVMHDDEEERNESRVFRVIYNSEIEDVRIEVGDEKQTIMFRFDPSWLLSSLAKAMTDPEE